MPRIPSSSSASPLIPRRKVLQGMALGAGLAAVGGWGPNFGSPAGALAGPGDRPYPLQPEGIDTMPQVEHIIIYMQENHSFDAYFGMLGRGDGFTLDGQGKPTNSNPDVNNQPVVVKRSPNTCNGEGSAGQSWNHTHLEINGGAMDGFARINPESMIYWDAAELPFYYGLARNFVVCDRWFASVPGQTHPNRRYLQAATSVGMVETSVAKVLAHPDAPNGLIWDRLNAHGISWTDYAYDIPDIALFPNFWKANGSHVKNIPQFLLDCKTGQLPAVSIVSPGLTDGGFSEESEDLQRGEAYSALLMNAVMNSPAWPRTVMFFTYDEHGGEYDHVPPPAAIAPDNIPPDITVPPDQPGGFDLYGLRVPSLVISPFAKKDYVSHVVHDHTSILRFIETKFNLGALTKRDANASNLLDTLDFNAKAFLEPPTLPAPALPDANSSCMPGAPSLPKAATPPPTTTTTTTTTPGSTTSLPGGTPSTPATPISGSPSFTG